MTLVAVKDQLALSRLLEAAHYIYERGLTRAVGADQAQNVTLSENKIDALEGTQSVEADAHI